jgi:hypothetical protein
MKPEAKTKRSKRKCVVKTVGDCSPSSSNGSPEPSTAAEAVTQSTSGGKFPPSQLERVVRLWGPGGDWTDHKLPPQPNGTTYAIGVVETAHDTRMTSNSLAISFEIREGLCAIVRLHQMGKVGWEDIQTIDLLELVTLRKLGGD